MSTQRETRKQPLGRGHFVGSEIIEGARRILSDALEELLPVAVQDVGLGEGADEGEPRKARRAGKLLLAQATTV